MKRKLMCMVLAVAMLVGVCVPSAFAANAPVTVTATADAWVSGSESDGVGTTLRIYAQPKTNTAAYRNFTYMNFSLFGVEISDNEVITDVKLKFYASQKDSNGGVTNPKLAFWTTSTPCVENSLSWNGQPADINTTDYYPAYEPAAIFDITSSIPSYTGSITNAPAAATLQSLDITDMFVSNFPNGLSSDSVFSFVMGIKGDNTSAGNKMLAILSRENSGKEPTLEITTEVIPDLAVDETTPAASSEGVNPNGDIVIEFNNTLGAVSAADVNLSCDGASVALADSDIDVAGNVLTISKGLETYSNYTVTLPADFTDAYGKKLSTPYSFTFKTSGDSQSCAVTVKADAGIVYNADPNAEYVSTSLLRELTDGKMSAGKTGAGYSRYALYKFDISNVPADKPLEKVIFTFTSEASSINVPVNWYVVPNGTWDDTTDAGKAAFDLDYYMEVNSAVTVNPDIAASLTVPFPGGSTTILTATADITAAVRAARAAGKTELTLAHCYDYLHNLYTKNASNASYRPSVTASYDNTPAIKVLSSNPANGAVMRGVEGPIELTLTTDITELDAQTYIKLLNNENEEVAADISYDDKTRVVTITPDDDLDSFASYKVVFEGGLTDAYGASIATQTQAITFTSGTPLEISDIKLTADASAEYDEAVNLPSYSAGDSITAIAKLVNNSSANQDAVLIIALFNQDNSMIAVQRSDSIDDGYVSALAQEEISVTLTVPANADNTYIKAFFWDNDTNMRPLCRAKDIAQISAQ